MHGGIARGSTHLERLKKMLARRIPLSTIHHRMRRKVREPIIRLVLVVEQDLRATIARALPKEVPKPHSTSVHGNSRNDGWLRSRGQGHAPQGRRWCGRSTIQVTAAATTTVTTVTFPLSLSSGSATTDDPLLVGHLNLGLNLNLSTARTPKRVCPGLSPSPGLARVDWCQTRLPILRSTIVVVSAIWGRRTASMARSSPTISVSPLSSHIVPRILFQDRPWLANRGTRS